MEETVIEDGGAGVDDMQMEEAVATVEETVAAVVIYGEADVAVEEATESAEIEVVEE